MSIASNGWSSATSRRRFRRCSSGEVDFWENPSLDLLPVVEAATASRRKVINKTGTQAQFYFNHIMPPFDNPKARQAMFWLTNQESYLQAINGNPEFYRTCPSFFTCGTPMETDAGARRA